MPVGRDSGRSPAPPQEPAERRPIRRVDDHRWHASWDRFQAAHDEIGDVADVAEPAVRAAEPPALTGSPRHQRPRPTRVVAAPATVVNNPTAPTADGHTASAGELTSLTLLRPRADRPAKGWRRLLRTATGINVGPSATEQRERDVLRRVATPVQGCHRIAVISLKGGVGKTTTTACLGLTLAHHRGDRVVALDANPDSGTLAERLTGQTSTSVSDLLAAVGEVRSYTDMSAYTSLAARLQVLGSEQRAQMSRPFDEDSYRAADEVLARFFNIVLVDSGTGLLHSAMTGTLSLANSLVVVAGPTVDAAGRAAKTLDWLVAHGRAELAARSVAVICAVRPDLSEVNVDVLREHFAARCREVIEVPYDPHLATGGRIDRTELQPQTAQAYLAAAAALAEGFALDD